MQIWGDIKNTLMSKLYFFFNEIFEQRCLKDTCIPYIFSESSYMWFIYVYNNFWEVLLWSDSSSPLLPIVIIIFFYYYISLVFYCKLALSIQKIACLYCSIVLGWIHYKLLILKYSWKYIIIKKQCCNTSLSNTNPT